MSTTINTKIVEDNDMSATTEDTNMTAETPKKKTRKPLSCRGLRDIGEG